MRCLVAYKMGNYQLTTRNLLKKGSPHSRLCENFKLNLNLKIQWLIQVYLQIYPKKTLHSARSAYFPFI